MTVKVLTVDDSKTIRMIVKKAFKAYDCELFEAENGEEGLSAADKNKPDLIVLDITMPVMNGVEMLGKLKSEASLKDIPVIMLTAESGKDNVLQIVKMGVKDYMVKPFKGDQLIERAEKIVQLEPKQASTSKTGVIEKCFSVDGDAQILALPDKITRPVILEIETYMKDKVKEMTDSGFDKLILDLSKLPEINVLPIKAIILVIESCQKSKINLRVVGRQALSGGLKGFAETDKLSLYASISEAKASF